MIDLFLKYKNRLQKSIWPVPIWSFFIFISFVAYFNLRNGSSITWTISLGILLWIRLCVAIRLLLTLILRHKGYILETRGKEMTRKTKIYVYILEILNKLTKPTFFTFQNALPRLSVPDLCDTISRYLKSIRPLVNDDQYEKILKDAEIFQKGPGKKLQSKLVKKSWISENYVSEDWENFHYLASREPLVYGTSVYISDNIDTPTTSQSARAANLIYVMIKYRENMKTFEPIRLRNIVPLCSLQYERLFNTTRIPGAQKDEMLHAEKSDHVVVIHKGIFYKINFIYEGNLLRAAEIQKQIEEILRSKSEDGNKEEKYIAGFTGLNRTKWAEIRKNHFSTGTNKNSLNEIESAAFAVSLDDEPFVYDLSSSPSEYGYYGKQLLVGNGYNRWFDKSFNLCVGSNGKAGLHADHTWGEANVPSNFFQECVIDDFYCYDENGQLNEKYVRNLQLKPQKLEWDFSDDSLKSLLKSSYNEVTSVIKNVDHQIAVHKKFSSGLIKSFKVSPDAFYQMAFQLAYYRQHKKFVLTYEPAITRLFKKGRTETIRTCTNESSKWVLAMEDENYNDLDRLNLLRDACKRHQELYLEAMYGDGVDRHLFCLTVAAQQENVTSEFLDYVSNDPFVILTSHIPHNQTPKALEGSKKFFISAGGAMPPASRNAYSVSYFPFNDEILFVHVSSMKNCDATNTETFLNGILTALNDIRELFEKEKNVN